MSTLPDIFPSNELCTPPTSPALPPIWDDQNPLIFTTPTPPSSPPDDHITKSGELDLGSLEMVNCEIAGVTFTSARSTISMPVRQQRSKHSVSDQCPPVKVASPSALAAEPWIRSNSEPNGTVVPFPITLEYVIATVRDLARDVSVLKDSTDKLEHGVRRMATARKTLDSRIERLNTEYTALEAKVLVVQSEQQDLKHDYKKLRCRIDRLDRRNDVINTEINHLKTVHDFILPVVYNHSLSTRLKRKRDELVQRRPDSEDPPTKRRAESPIRTGRRR